MQLDQADILYFYNLYKTEEFNYSANRIIERRKEMKDDLIELNKVYEFWDKNIIGSAKIQKLTSDYLLDKYSVSLGKLYEKQLNSHSWQDHIFNAYVRLVNSGIYYPDEHNTIYTSIRNQSASSNRTFWNMFTLASCCKDDKTFIDSIALILDKKKTHKTLSSLDLDKIQKFWNKRFKNIDFENISPDSLSIIKPYFELSQSHKERDFFSIEQGNYITLNIDLNVICQHNKISLSKNQDALRLFFNQFSSFITRANQSSDNSHLLSISGFNFSIVDSSKTTISFNYSDIQHKNLISSLACDLVDYATSKHDKNTLKGQTINLQSDKDLFFSSFLQNYALQHSLPQKETTSVKKSKL
jgi:hypothetical protein